VPQALTTRNYVSLFSGREFGAYLANSIIVTAASVAIALISDQAPTPARFRLRGGMHRLRGLQPADGPAAAAI